MHFNSFKKMLFEKAIAFGFEHCALEFQSNSSFEVKIFQGEISEYKNAQSNGLAFRGLFQGNMGYAFTERMDESIIDLVIENAAFNSKITNEGEKEVLFKGDDLYPICNGYNESLESYTVEDKINFAKDMEKIAYALDERVKSVDYCVFANGVSETYICNTLGLDLNKKNNAAIAYIGCRLVQDNQVKSSSEAWFGNDLRDFNAKKLVYAAVQKGISYLNAKSVKTGNYEVILHKETASKILASYVSIFFAETIQKGFSLLKGKLQTSIASDKITIRDDGIYKNNLGNTAFDSEGVATKNKLIVDKGILKTYLYNLKSASIDNTSSTGNGFKTSLKSPVTTACTNFYILPSNTTYDQLIKTMKNGLTITEVSGLHSGINFISGDFSLSASGFLVKSGQIIQAVEQITIAGNFFDMLKDVTEVADDLRFNYPSGYGTIGSPSIKVGNLAVSGT